MSRRRPVVVCGGLFTALCLCNVLEEQLASIRSSVNEFSSILGFMRAVLKLAGG